MYLIKSYLCLFPHLQHFVSNLGSEQNELTLDDVIQYHAWLFVYAWQRLHQICPI